MADGDEEGRSISPGYIEAVQRDIYAVLVRTDEHSPLSGAEKDAELSRACGQACDFLTRWLDSEQWQDLKPARRGRAADVLAQWDKVEPYLTPVRETLERIAERGADAPRALAIREPAVSIEWMISSARQTVRRNPEMDCTQLFDEATARMKGLRAEVCRLADDLKQHTDSQVKRAQRQRKARSFLKTLAWTVLPLALTVVMSVTPATIGQTAPAWAHEVVSVLFVHGAAHAAAPAVRISPPQAGPRLGGP